MSDPQTTEMWAVKREYSENGGYFIAFAYTKEEAEVIAHDAGAGAKVVHINIEELP